MSPSASTPDPLIAPLRDTNYLVRALADVSGLDATEVASRLSSEHQDLGAAVRQELEAKQITPHEWSDELIAFYNATDAFLFESAAWNRSKTKNQMRNWIGHHLRRHFPEGAHLLTYGDGLGFDSFYLAEAGHRVDYFDLSDVGARLVRRMCEDFGVEVRVLADADHVEPQTYDAVVCLDVLEHVPSPPETVDFLTRALHDEGRLIVHAPFWYLTSAVSTHLKSSRRFSGSRQLYRRAGLTAVDGALFWNPLVLVKSSQRASSDSFSAATRIRLGGALLSVARLWARPHEWIWSWLYRSQWQAWPELDEWNQKEEIDR